MADKNCDRISTNDEIVNDLVKDFEQNLGSVEEEGAVPEVLRDATHGADDDLSEDEASSRTKTMTVPLPEDHIDEAALADQSSRLSEVEKVTNRCRTQELKAQGNTQFGAQEYMASIDTYTQALRVCPTDYSEDRAVLYANRAASKAKLERKETAIDDCTQAIKLKENYVKAYLRRAKLYEDTEKFDESLNDYKKILELDPGNRDATAASVRLPPIINERNEKMKTEMMGKLKDLGNMILKPFGLSTENFQLQQDPNSGGYSINFQQSQQRKS